MDDKNFDEKSANEWAQMIEAHPINKRDEYFYPKINDWLKETNAQNVLDLGCGQGICSSKLELDHCSYYGTDPSSFLIDRAKELYPKFKDQFQLGNAYELPYRDNQFDNVFSIAVWHLLEDIELASKELHRVLKEKGHFLIITASKNCFSDWKAAYENIEVDGDKLVGKDKDMNVLDILYIRTDNDLKTTLANFDLEVTHIEQNRMWTLIQGRKLQN